MMIIQRYNNLMYYLWSFANQYLKTLVKNYKKKKTKNKNKI